MCLKTQSDSYLGDWLLEPDPAPAMAARSLVCQSQQGFVYSRLLNPRNETVILKQGTCVAHLEHCTLADVCSVSGSMDGTSFLKEDALRSLVQKNDSNLFDGRQHDLLNLVLQYQDIFSMGKADLGHTNLFTHSIDTGGARPIKQPLRRLPHSKREDAIKLLQEMLHGLHQLSSSRRKMVPLDSVLIIVSLMQSPYVTLILFPALMMFQIRCLVRIGSPLLIWSVDTGKSPWTLQIRRRQHFALQRAYLNLK